MSNCDQKPGSRMGVQPSILAGLISSEVEERLARGRHTESNNLRSADCQQLPLKGSPEWPKNELSETRRT